MMRQKMTGARFIAETFKGYGVSYVFFVEAILRRALVAMESLGIRRVLTHSEKTSNGGGEMHHRFYKLLERQPTFVTFAH
jgi:hypothetical protein